MPNHKKLLLLNYLSFLKEQPQGFVYEEKTPKNIANNGLQSKSTHHKPSKQSLLDQIKAKYQNCSACPLAQQGKKQVVFGQGNADAQLMFVGEGPGRDEDEQGCPFIGRAGQLLTKIIQAMGMQREDVYISNVVKCRPPNNRVPLPQESETCKNLILFEEIKIISPKVICALGSTALQALLGEDARITKNRGIFSQFHGIPLLPTYHPAYLLRNPAAKKLVWEDMQKIMNKFKAY